MSHTTTPADPPTPASAPVTEPLAVTQRLPRAQLEMRLLRLALRLSDEELACLVWSSSTYGVLATTANLIEDRFGRER